MTRWIAVFSVLLLFVAGGAQAVDIRTETVTYTANGTEFEGYVAYDADIDGERPGVLVVHEWWGLDAHARDRAEALAEAGYTALALDMYGQGRVADHPDEAGAMAGEVRQNMDRMKRRFTAAEAVLREHDTVNADEIAAIGYCFGGGVVLEMARQGADLEAVASFHGSLGTQDRARPGDVEAAILVLHGEDDQLAPEEDLDAFRKEMVASATDFRVVTYPDAQHGFTNPEADRHGERFDLPIGYNEEAAEASWQEMLDFLDAELGQ